MADVVLTVAKSLVEGTLTKAQLAIEEENKLRKRAQRDLVFIAGEFQMMKSFLSVTTKEKIKNNIVSTCVTQVRDLAYDVEDCIEFILHLDTKPDWWRRMIPACMAPSRPLDQAVDILEHLKARVQDLSERSSRYKLISDDHPASISNEMRQLATSRASDLMLRDMDALTKLVTKSGNDHQVISVLVLDGDHGAPSLSLIRKAYNNPKIWTNFSLRAWVDCKLGNPFNLPQFLRSMKDQLCGDGSVQPVADDVDRLSTMVRDTLDSKKYLVVLEGLSTMVDWDTILQYFPVTSNGSRIVVLTDQIQVAGTCTGFPHIQSFWADHSLCVIYKDTEATLVGRMPEINIPSVNQLTVMSVWGIAGAGKSAVVRNVCLKKLHSSNIHKRCIWMDASDPYSLKNFCEGQSFALHLDSHEANQMISSTVELGLVVIDNLHTTENWELIRHNLATRLPAGSVIIVITNDESIALHCADKERVFNVRGLEIREALLLFKEVVKHKNINEDRIKTLIPKCGGLPKVIVAVADYLSSQFYWEDHAIKLAEKFVDNLEAWSDFTCLHGLFSWMHSYLGALPEPLKQHVAYLLIFPGQSSVRRRRLLMRWVAEGYSRDSDSYTANENAEKHFSKLVELSMVHQPFLTTITGMSTEMVTYEVSNMFYEYMVAQPPEENVATAIEIFELQGSCSPTSRRTGRHLVIGKEWDRDKIVFKNIDFSRLRSLTVFGKWKSFFISKTMKVLRVLDLEDASGVTNKDLHKILKRLPRLKFLSLRGCSEINYLPSSVGELRQLQILDVRYSNIVTIPMSITKLKKLQYIRAGPIAPIMDPSGPRTVAFKLSELQTCLRLAGVNVMSGIGKLSALHTLGVINVGGIRGKFILKELRNLTQLRKLGVSGVSKKNGKELCSAVSCHSRLQSLTVWLKKDNENCLHGMFPDTAVKPSDPKKDTAVKPSGPKKFLSLKLYGPLKQLPMWIEHLCNLRKLNLEVDVLSQNDIGVLGNLKQLCILRLRVNPPQAAPADESAASESQPERAATQPQRTDHRVSEPQAQRAVTQPHEPDHRASESQAERTVIQPQRTDHKASEINFFVAEGAVTQPQGRDHRAGGPQAERVMTQPQGTDHRASEPNFFVVEKVVTQSQGTDHRASEINFFVAERAVTQPQGPDHRASASRAERTVIQPQRTDHKASEINFFVAERAVTQPQGTDHRASGPQAERVVTQPQETDHRASEPNFFVAEKVVTQPQGIGHRASEINFFIAERAGTQPQGTIHRASEPQAEMATTQPQGTDHRASDPNFFVAERVVIQPQRIDHRASEPQAERAVTQPQGTDHRASEPNFFVAEKVVTQPQGTGHRASEINFFVAERAGTQPQGTDHRASEPQAKMATTQPQGTDHRASDPNFFVAERVVIQPQRIDHRGSEPQAERAVIQLQGTNHRANEPQAERAVIQPQGTNHRASEPQAERAVTQPQGIEHRASELNLFVAERVVTQPQGTDHRSGELNFCVLINGVEDRCYIKLQVLEIASRSSLHLSIGKKAMENLEVLKAGCCSTGSLPQFGSLDHLKKLKEVQVIGSFNDERCSFPF